MWVGSGAIYRDRETGRKVRVEVRSRVLSDVLILRGAIGNQVASCIYVCSSGRSLGWRCKSGNFQHTDISSQRDG